MAQLRLSLVRRGQRRVELTPFHQWRREEGDEDRAWNALPPSTSDSAAPESYTCERQRAASSVHEEQRSRSATKHQVRIPDWDVRARLGPPGRQTSSLPCPAS
jgi:hypothetical protein